MLMDKNTQYCQDSSSFQLGLYIQSNANQNPTKASYDVSTNWFKGSHGEASDLELST